MIKTISAATLGFTTSRTAEMRPEMVLVQQTDGAGVQYVAASVTQPVVSPEIVTELADKEDLARAAAAFRLYRSALVAEGLIASE